MTNPFWEFSLAIYRLEGVAGACIELQDKFDMDVNLLLYGVWLASQDRVLENLHLSEMEVVISTWREAVVKPLRDLRRQWRMYPEADAIRNEVKALELQAERQQQDMMLVFHGSAPGLPRSIRPLRENMRLVAQFCSPDRGGWDPAIGHLVSLLDW